jgi:threonine synthase
MRYVSTRGGESITLEDAIMSGTAPDGGLYVPENLPHFDPAKLPADAPIAEFAAIVLEAFFAGSSLEGELQDICQEVFNFPAPLRPISEGHEKLSVLELFHGPTAAFKDFGARFLAACMSRIIRQRGNDSPTTILVATSGDTGGAVAAAFHKQPGVRVVVLFPVGRVSPRQQHQLTCWGDNIISLAVKGEFDDCQRLVKQLFADADQSRQFNLCSANSINVGRLMPQSIYYAKTSLDYFAQHGASSNFIIPTGNLGNAFACAWAKQMGFPIGDMILATNANRTIPDYLDSGTWEPRASIATLASAMDVGDPSNMERLRSLWGDADQLRNRVRSFAVTDAEIRSQIRAEFGSQAIAWCPHTATGFHVYRNRLSSEERAKGHGVIAATAHAAKFNEIVEPLIGETVPVPDELDRLLHWSAKFDIIEADAEQIIGRLK